MESDAVLKCPVCFQETAGLEELNSHLDVDHGFQKAQNRNQERGKRSSEGKVTRSHWQLFDRGKTRCSECGEVLDTHTGAVNCSKCGKMYCQRHCHNAIKLNRKAHFSPGIHGRWCICCYRCFQGKPGYNDAFGQIYDVTDTFAQLRSTKLQDTNLRRLQLEQRLIRLVQLVARIQDKMEGNIMSTMAMHNQMKKIEQTITPWKDDKSVHDCKICGQQFNFLLLRKHHCRTCGEVVCASLNTNCSDLAPVEQLVNAAPDLNFDVKRAPGYSIRLCIRCKRIMFQKRKFERDIQNQLPSIFYKYERVRTYQRVIQKQLPVLQKQLAEVSNKDEPTLEANLQALSQTRTKFLQMVKLYNDTVKQITILQGKTTSETKILNSIKSVTSEFITQRVMPFKSIPAVLDPTKNSPESKSLSELMTDNLSIKEVKQHREELMVLQEQQYLVSRMIEEAKKQRKFDEIVTLTKNCDDLSAKIGELRQKLGQEGF